MKVTNADIIKSGERELIDSIIGDLDWNMIEQIVRERHRLKIQDDIDYRQGDLIVHDNQVAYKLDFDVKMTLSVIFDRDGNYLSLSTSEDLETDQGREPETMPDEEAAVATDASEVPAPDDQTAFLSEDAPSADPESEPPENFSKMASHIAEMISEINDD